MNGLLLFCHEMISCPLIPADCSKRNIFPYTTSTWTMDAIERAWACTAWGVYTKYRAYIVGLLLRITVALCTALLKWGISLHGTRDLLRVGLRGWEPRLYHTVCKNLPPKCEGPAFWLQTCWIDQAGDGNSLPPLTPPPLSFSLSLSPSSERYRAAGDQVRVDSN